MGRGCWSLLERDWGVGLLPRVRGNRLVGEGWSGRGNVAVALFEVCKIPASLPLHACASWVEKRFVVCCRLV